MFEVGKTYKNTNGNSQSIICLWADEKHASFRWSDRPEGLPFSLGHPTSTYYKRVEKIQHIKEYWLNIYPDAVMSHNSKEIADFNKGTGCVGQTGPHYFKWIEEI